MAYKAHTVNMTCGRIIEYLMVSRHRDTHLRLDIADRDRTLESTQIRHIIECPRPNGLGRYTHLRLDRADHNGALESTQTHHIIGLFLH